MLGTDETSANTLTHSVSCMTFNVHTKVVHVRVCVCMCVCRPINGRRSGCGQKQQWCDVLMSDRNDVICGMTGGRLLRTEELGGAW